MPTDKAQLVIPLPYALPPTAYRNIAQHINTATNTDRIWLHVVADTVQPNIAANSTTNKQRRYHTIQHRNDATRKYTVCQRSWLIQERYQGITGANTATYSAPCMTTDALYYGAAFGLIYTPVFEKGMSKKSSRGRYQEIQLNVARRHL